ncbi:MAG: FKBP-type peptidyl-prolyl cis-trans isomerase [Balneola sp.]
MFFKKALFIPLLTILLAPSTCIKKNVCDGSIDLKVDQTTLNKDIEILDSYLSDNNISAQVDSTGIRYIINKEGSGKRATPCSKITITYLGKKLDGKVIDLQKDPEAHPLNDLIVGWQIGLSKIKEGGAITLYVPSGYAYGKKGTDGIPPYTNLIFQINLLEVQ